MRLDPGNTVLRNNLAMLLDQQLQRPEEALYQYRRALELDPLARRLIPQGGSPQYAAEVHNNLALLYETRMHKVGDALRHYRRALVAKSLAHGHNLLSNDWRQRSTWRRTRTWACCWHGSR